MALGVLGHTGQMPRTGPGGVDPAQYGARCWAGAHTEPLVFPKAPGHKGQVPVKPICVLSRDADSVISGATWERNSSTEARPVEVGLRSDGRRVGRERRRQ